MFDKLKKAIGINKKDSRSPTLDTVNMVENFIKDNSGKLKKTELFKKLPKKVMWGTFQVIIKYLEESKKIITNENKLITYIFDKVSYKQAEEIVQNL